MQEGTTALVKPDASVKLLREGRVACVGPIPTATTMIPKTCLARRIILRAIEESDVPTPGDARGANPSNLETARPERGAVGRGIDSRTSIL